LPKDHGVLEQSAHNRINSNLYLPDARHLSRQRITVTLHIKGLHEGSVGTLVAVISEPPQVSHQIIVVHQLLEVAYQPLQRPVINALPIPLVDENTSGAAPNRTERERIRLAKPRAHISEADGIVSSRLCATWLVSGRGSTKSIEVDTEWKHRPFESLPDRRKFLI
jgi:hypothetical protein